MLAASVVHGLIVLYQKSKGFSPMWIIFLLLFSSTVMAAEREVVHTSSSLSQREYTKGRNESAVVVVPAENLNWLDVGFDITKHTDPTVCADFRVEGSEDGKEWRLLTGARRCGGPAVQRD